jgi:M6 family metalloprotease-like protein
MTMRKTALLLGVATAALGGSAPATAQDIEALALARGITLPAGYYERVARDPDFFELRRGWRNRTPASRTNLQNVTTAAFLPEQGNLRMAVVMTLFAGSAPPPFSTEITQQRLFGPNPTGSLTDYYREISGGRVNLTGSVLPWTRTTVTLGDAVGSSVGLGQDAQIGAYVVSALKGVDGTVNFGQFDSDGPDGVPNSADDDGFVDVAVFQYSEGAASCGGPGPWPHRGAVSGWTGKAYTTDDLRPNGQPVMVNEYIMQSAVDCDGQPQAISTIAHETGHAFGLPDSYDHSGGILPADRRWVVGCWTLMGAGSWGCGDGGSFEKVPLPPHMGAYEKRQLGWIDETEARLEISAQYTLPPVQTSAKSLRIPLRGATEYLLLEYRPNTGFDSGLPVGGVLMYHVDTSLPLLPCATCPRKYRVRLVEADGNEALMKTVKEGGNRGEPGDVFTGRRVLTDETTPSLRLNSGQASNLVVVITVQGGQAQVQMMNRPQLNAAQIVGPYLGGVALSPEAQETVDAMGNANGSFDLGDVRAYLRTAP